MIFKADKEMTISALSFMMNKRGLNDIITLGILPTRSVLEVGVTDDPCKG